MKENCKRGVLRKCFEGAALIMSRVVHPFRLRHESWGCDFPEKKFLVIRRRGYGMGLFSYFITNLGWIRYAFNNGYIPVVDMKTNRTIYHQDDENRENVWEYFFNQPAGYTLTDIAHAKDIYIVDAAAFPGDSGFLPSLGPDEDIDNGRNADSLASWRNLAYRYAVPKVDAIKTLTSSELEHALSDRGVIGVLARGSDYSHLRPGGHAVQPTTTDFFSAIAQYDQKCGTCLPIFLVTEDAEIASSFSTMYGNRLIMSKQDLVQYDGGLLCKNVAVVGNLQRGFGYLKAIVDVSRCPVLIAGRTSGTIGAAVLSKGFKYSKIFNLGTY